MKEGLYLFIWAITFPIICFIQFYLTQKESWYELGVWLIEVIGYVILFIIIIGIIIEAIRWFIYGENH